MFLYVFKQFNFFVVDMFIKFSLTTRTKQNQSKSIKAEFIKVAKQNS